MDFEFGEVINSSSWCIQKNQTVITFHGNRIIVQLGEHAIRTMHFLLRSNRLCRSHALSHQTKYSNRRNENGEVVEL